MRARFVDAEGRSFFDDIAKHDLVILRHVPAEYTFDASADSYVKVVGAKRDRYRREEWFIPVGPVACPLPPMPGDHEDGFYDVVYRFDGMERR